MAQTIAELEKERAELLKAIENQAQQISSTRSAEDNTEKNHTLTDWLAAAEEVMPSSGSTPRHTQENPSAQESSDLKPQTSKTSFFGVIILLTLLLTILGVLYIAYTTINQELKQVVEIKESSQADTERLEASIQELQQNLASGGQPEIFIQLEERVLRLESQLEQIQQQQAELLAELKTNRTAAMPLSVVGEATAEGDDPGSVEAPDRVVTEAVLEQKLKTYTSQLEARLEQKLEVILRHLTSEEAPSTLNDSTPTKEPSKPSAKAPANETPSLAEPSEPSVPQVKLPVLEQPIVKLVSEVKAPAVETPKPTAQALKAYTSDEQWLLDQPAQHYILQLASMADKQALLTMVMQKGLPDTKIVAQTRQDATRYVLLTGSFPSRSEVNSRASTIKNEFGISPWIRKVGDLTARLP
jgi:septal ring-binding cell division protein DamX